MSFSLAASLFYITVTLAAVLGFYLYAKSDTMLYAGTWIPISFLALMGYQTLISGLLSLVKIKVNIISVGLFNLAAAAVLWFFIIRNKKIQKYKFEWADFASGLLIFAAILWVINKRYGADLNPTYNSVDPSVHFKSARNVINNQRVWGMYYSALHNGLLIETLGAFVKAADIYKIYVAGDILHLILAGVMFWGVIRSYAKDNMLRIVGIIATPMYTMGYPLNSTLFGFSYLGMGVTVVAFIVAAADIYTKDEINKKWSIVLLSLGCYSIFQSYVLFMPVVFFSLLACALVKQFKDKKLISLSTVWIGLSIFLPATILGLWYTYGGIFGSSGSGGTGGGTTVASAINIEGGIYSDLYTNFIFMIPLALFGFVSIIRDKKNKYILYALSLELVFMLAMLIKAVRREVSAYYYYKNYYMLWLIVWILFYMGIYYLEKNEKLIAVFTLGLWIMITCMSYRDIEYRIAVKNPYLCSDYKAYDLSHIYSFNRTFLVITDSYSEDKLDIYAYAVDNILSEDKTYIPLAGSAEDYYWMQAITNQSDSDYQYWNKGADVFFLSLKEDDIHYIMVFKDNDFYNNYIGYFGSMNRVYENETGFIGVVE